MMKLKSILFCSAALTVAAAGPVRAQVIVDVSQITCEQFLTASPNAIEVAIWMSGYYNGLRKNTQLNLNQFKNNADALVAECRADPKKTMMQAADKLMPQK